MINLAVRNPCLRISAFKEHDNHVVDRWFHLNPVNSKYHEIDNRPDVYDIDGLYIDDVEYEDD